MPGPLLIGLGVAAAAFFGRAGYVALRKSRGAITQAGALGKAFYKGGFEPKMNRREASLILEIKYVYRSPESQVDKANSVQREDVDQGQDTEEASTVDAIEPSRSGRKSIPGNESQRGERTSR